MLESIRANDSLVPGGKLFLPTGTLQAEGRILEVARRIFGAANLQSLLQRELPLDRFITTATNGVEFAPRPGIERLVLIPSFLQRPLVSHLEVGEVMIIVFPVADESVTAETDAPPLRLVRLSKAHPKQVRALLLRSRKATAPKRLVKDFAET